MSEGLHNSAYVHPQMQRPGERLPSIGDWPPPETPRHLPHPSGSLPALQPSQTEINHISASYRSQVSPNGAAPPSWKYGASEVARRESVSNPYESNDVRPTLQDHNDNLTEWDDEMIDE